MPVSVLPVMQPKQWRLGASACLVNTAIAVAGNPVTMAEAFKQAVEAGRMAYEAGLGLQADNFVAEASSPLTAFLDESNTHYYNISYEIKKDKISPLAEKVYMPGTIYPKLHVGMRKVEQVPSTTFADEEKVITPNPDIYIYDTSGPFSDPDIEIDLKKGLPRLREPWISAPQRCGATTGDYLGIRPNAT